MPTLEVIKLIINGGELAILAAVLYGIFKLADKYIPLLLAAWTAHTSAIVDLKGKVEQLITAVGETRARASEASEDVAEIRGAVMRTGAHPAVNVERQPLEQGRGKR